MITLLTYLAAGIASMIVLLMIAAVRAGARYDKSFEASSDNGIFLSNERATHPSPRCGWTAFSDLVGEQQVRLTAPKACPRSVSGAKILPFKRERISA